MQAYCYALRLCPHSALFHVKAAPAPESSDDVWDEDAIEWEDSAGAAVPAPPRVPTLTLQRRSSVDDDGVLRSARAEASSTAMIELDDVLARSILSVVGPSGGAWPTCSLSPWLEQ